MSKWNLSNPRIAGDEWPGAALQIVQAGKSIGVGCAMTAQATENIDVIETMLRGINPPSALAVDIYDLAAPIVDAQSVQFAVPGANFSNSAGWSKSTGGVISAYGSTAWSFVDDPVGENDPINQGASTQLIYVGIGPTSVAQIMFQGPGADIFDGNTGAGGAAFGARIGAVTVLAIVENVDAIGNVRFDGYLNIGGTRYSSDSGPIIINQGQGLTRARFNWYYNPVTGRAWTLADVIALSDGTDAFGIGVITKNKFGNFTVTTVQLRAHTQVERRLATGFANSTTFDQYSGYQLVDPADGATPVVWSKNGGSRYLVLFSQTNRGSPGQLSVVRTSPVRGHESDAFPFSNQCGCQLAPGGIPVAQQVEDVGQFGMLLLISGGGVSDDTNPYVDVVDELIGTGPDCFGTTTRQGVSVEGTDEYGMAFVLVASTGNGAGGILQDQPLTISLHDAGDDSLLAGPTDITIADAPPDGKYHLVQVPWSPGAALTAGQAVYILAESTSVAGWHIPLLCSRSRFMSPADGFSLDAALAGIGSTSDMTDADPTLDWPWAILTVPPALDGLTSSTACIPNKPVLDYKGLLPGIQPTMPQTICFAELAWNASGLGGEFGYYEVQRVDPDGVAYTIAKVTNEATPLFNDFEMVRDTPVDYRVRVVRFDGAFSDWTDFAPVTVAIEHCQDIVLASNFDPDRACAVQDLGGVHAWAPRQAQSPVYVEIYGRDDPVGFFGGEEGGESFSRELVVAMNDTAVDVTLQPDRAMFNVLIALLHDRLLPYVSYTDGFRQRWYVSATVQTPRKTDPGSQYVATTAFVQVARQPTPVVTDAPWTP